MYYVYLLECRDKSLYCGYTPYLEKRVSAHSAGQGAKYTKSRLPVKLVYFEEFEEKTDALKREFVIKKMKRHEKLALIEKKQQETI